VKECSQLILEAKQPAGITSPFLQLNYADMFYAGFGQSSRQINSYSMVKKLTMKNSEAKVKVRTPKSNALCAGVIYAPSAANSRSLPRHNMEYRLGPARARERYVYKLRPINP